MLAGLTYFIKCNDTLRTCNVKTLGTKSKLLYGALLERVSSEMDRVGVAGLTRAPQNPSTLREVLDQKAC